MVLQTGKSYLSSPRVKSRRLNFIFSSLIVELLEKTKSALFFFSSSEIWFNSRLLKSSSEIPEAIIIDNEDVAKTFKSYFEFMW